MQTPGQLIAEKSASVLMYVGSATAVFFGWLNDNAGAVGAVVAIIGLGVNLWFKHRHLSLVEKAAHDRPDCVTCPDRSAP